MEASGVVPDDLADRWHLTEWSLALNAWPLHIAFATYPPPACFDVARRYEAKAIEVAETRAALNAKKKRPRAQPKPQPKEQLELWQESAG